VGGRIYQMASLDLIDARITGWAADSRGCVTVPERRWFQRK
jgi:hypothetical protein